MAEISDATPPPPELNTQPVAQVTVETVDRNVMASSSTIAAAQSDFATQSNVEVASWNCLPVELKTKVLAVRLVVPRALTSKTHELYSKTMNLINLMLTSKEMHELAASVYYGSNTFMITTGLPFFHFCKARNSPWHAGDFKVPNLTVGKLVRRLEFHVKLGALLPPDLFEHHHPSFSIRMPEELRYEPGLLCLVEPLEGSNGWRERRWSDKDARSSFVPSAGWQYSFPALKQLRIVFHGRQCLLRSPTIGNCPNSAFIQLPQYARIPLRPLEVQVEVEDHVVFDLENGCRGRECGNVLRGVIRSMVKLRAPE